MNAVQTKLWVTGPETERWFDAARVMWSTDFHPETLSSLGDVPIHKRNLRSSQPITPEVILWAGDQNGIHELIQWLHSRTPQSDHRLYIAAGQWSDAECSVLQRFGVRLIVSELTDLIAIEHVVREWSLRISN